MDSQVNTALPVSLIHEPGNYLVWLDWGQVFSKPQPIEVELGCGDSNLIVELARRHPERNFLGVERLWGRLKKLDRKGRRAGLSNLRGLRIEASYCLEFLLPPNSIQTLHIYFPDPWPKRRHWNKRLVNARFTGVAATRLLPGGVVYLRTDDDAYFRQMTEVFGTSTAFRPVDTPTELAETLTDFEKEFLAQGKATHHAAYERLPGDFKLPPPPPYPSP